MNHILTQMLTKTSASALIALLPVCVLSAYTSGSGTSGDPYIIDASDGTMDSGFYAAGSNVTLSGDYISVGYNHTGSLTIANGWTVTNGLAYIGYISGSVGNVVVTGKDSTWSTTNTLCVGVSGTGTLSVENGGTLASLDAQIGSSYDGVKGTVTLAGRDADGTSSKWVNTNNLYVSTNCPGELSVGEGCTVSAKGIVIGYKPGVLGTVAVSGKGAALTATNGVSVGDNGDGVLEVRDGGAVSCDYLYVGNANGTNGNLVVSGSGSRVMAPSFVLVGLMGTGTIRVEDNALLVTGALQSYAGDSVELEGGHIALKSNEILSDSAIVGKQLYYFGGFGYEAVTADNIASLKAAKLITVTYYDASKYVAGDALYDTYAAKGIDLSAGYTVISGGVVDMDWADLVGADGGWLESSWLGWYYADATYGHWIWSCTHGWLSVYDLGNNEIAAWDDSLQTWWYSNKDWYPALYDYVDGNWYYYMNGVAPSRTFWSYAKGHEVTENK